jgi:hypothetical protein
VSKLETTRSMIWRASFVNTCLLLPSSGVRLSKYNITGFVTLYLSQAPPWLFPSLIVSVSDGLLLEGST